MGLEIPPVNEIHQNKWFQICFRFYFLYSNYASCLYLWLTSRLWSTLRHGGTSPNDLWHDVDSNIPQLEAIKDIHDEVARIGPVNLGVGVDMEQHGRRVTSAIPVAASSIAAK